MDTAQEFITNISNPSVAYLTADFSDLDQGRSSVITFQDRHPHLDVLVNNGGGFLISGSTYIMR